MSPTDRKVMEVIPGSRVPLHEMDSNRPITNFDMKKSPEGMSKIMKEDLLKPNVPLRQVRNKKFYISNRDNKENLFDDNVNQHIVPTFNRKIEFTKVSDLSEGYNQGIKTEPDCTSDCSASNKTDFQQKKSECGIIVKQESISVNETVGNTTQNSTQVSNILKIQNAQALPKQALLSHPVLISAMGPLLLAQSSTAATPSLEAHFPKAVTPSLSAISCVTPSLSAISCVTPSLSAISCVTPSSIHSSLVHTSISATSQTSTTTAAVRGCDSNQHTSHAALNSADSKIKANADCAPSKVSIAKNYQFPSHNVGIIQCANQLTQNSMRMLPIILRKSSVSGNSKTTVPVLENATLLSNTFSSSTKLALTITSTPSPGNSISLNQSAAVESSQCLQTPTGAVLTPAEAESPPTRISSDVTIGGTNSSPAPHAGAESISPVPPVSENSSAPSEIICTTEATPSSQVTSVTTTSYPNAFAPQVFTAASSSFPNDAESQSDKCGVRVAPLSRRNARERNRVRQVSQGFAILRQHVPQAARRKKLSKVETLRCAVEYIKALSKMIEEHNDNTNNKLHAYHSVDSTPPPSAGCSPAGGTTLTPVYLARPPYTYSFRLQHEQLQACRQQQQQEHLHLQHQNVQSSLATPGNASLLHKHLSVSSLTGHSAGTPTPSTPAPAGLLDPAVFSGAGKDGNNREDTVYGLCGRFDDSLYQSSPDTPSDSTQLSSVEPSPSSSTAASGSSSSHSIEDTSSLSLLTTHAGVSPLSLGELSTAGNDDCSSHDPFDGDDTDQESELMDYLAWWQETP